MQCHDRPISSPIQGRDYDVHRCLPTGMRRSLELWQMASAVEVICHQLAGVGSDPTGFHRISTAGREPSCPGEVRQDSCCIHQQPWRNQVQTAVLSGQINLDLVLYEQHQTTLLTHRRSAQCQSRPTKPMVRR